MIITIIALILCLKILTHESLLQLLRKYLMMIPHEYSKNVHRKTSYQLMSVSLVIWLLLLKTIYFTCIQTELLITKRGEDINSFDDVIKKNMSITHFYRKQCYMAYKNIAQYSPRFNKSFRVIRRKESGWNESWQRTGLIDRVIIGREITLLAAKLGRCVATGVSSNSFHRSKKPMFSQVLSQIHHQNLEKRKRISLNRWGYTGLELELQEINLQFAKKFFEYRSKKPLKASCWLYHEESIFISNLQMSFLADFFLSFIFNNLIHCFFLRGEYSVFNYS